MDVMLKRCEQPDEVRRFEKGKFEIVRIGGMTIGRASYEPGWRWSLHVGQATGASSCSVEHVGIVVSGRATAAMDSGTITEMRPGDVFYIAPGHDSWVVGQSPTSHCIFSARTATPTLTKGSPNRDAGSRAARSHHLGGSATREPTPGEPNTRRWFGHPG